MKKKGKFNLNRILFVVLIVLIFLAVNYYQCILLSFSARPGSIKKVPGKKEILILYGIGLCQSCPAGKYLKTLNKRTDILYVVPEDFENSDIENLKDVFMLKGEVIKGDKELVKLLKRIRGCKGLDTWKMNFSIQVEENGKWGSITAF